MRGLPRKTLVECGYDLMDRQIAEYAARPKVESDRPVVLIAPSWQEDCLLDVCADEVISPLLGKGYKVIVRPHPEYTKRYRARWESLQQRYSAYSADELYFEQDFSTSESIYDSDVLITDWSSIACEFSFATLKPSIFVDTPMKVWNPDWRELGIEPTDITMRNQIGSSIAVDDLGRITEVVADMLENPDRWRDRMLKTRGEMIYNLGAGGEAAGSYLLRRMLEIQEAKRGER